jgi:hypothetical protein
MSHQYTIKVRIWWVQKRFPQYGIHIWSLWPNIRFLSSIVAEKNATKNEHIHVCSMCIKINKVGLSWFLYTLNILCTFFVTFFSATIDGRDLIFGHKLHIGTPYRGKRFWTHQIPTSCLPNIRFLPSIVAEKNATKNEHICSMCIKINKVGKQEVGIRWVQKHFPQYGVPIWSLWFLDPSDSYFLFADLVGFYTHWTYMHIFRHIFLSNYWWQRSDIWSQASYRYPISWEAFLDPSDSYYTQ